MSCRNIVLNIKLKIHTIIEEIMNMASVFRQIQNLYKINNGMRCPCYGEYLRIKIHDKNEKETEQHKEFIV